MTDTSAVDRLSLPGKAALGSGASFWATKSGPDLPAAVLTDGPHGVRAQEGAADHLGIGASVPATCFPPAVGMAQSWDRELVGRIGAALGREARSHGVGVLLGPGVNLKRDPRGGRNFEYYSEDPYLSGVLGAAWVRGLQAEGVGAAVKHFAANNAEHDRMRSDSRVDPRALREVYLRAFERVVTTASPWTVMCSYNKLNGVQVAEDRWLLTDVLRGEWGFDGAVVSDWGAVRDPVASVAAGLDLRMPGADAAGDEAVAAAVEGGVLDEGAVTAAARNVVGLLARAAAAGGDAPPVDLGAHHALAREAAGRGVVLLKNDGDLLPLPGGESLAVIGRFAAQPRYQGGGSSHVNATRVDVPLDEIRALGGDAAVSYEPGFPGGDPGADDDGDRDPDRLRADAEAAARAADAAVVFLGLGQREESEGFDRDHIELPAEQLALLRAVVAVQPRTVVVLSHGGVVRLAEVDALAPAVLDGGLLGQAAGGGIADVLFGAVNPSGRLAETVPVRIQDVPSYLTFPGEHSRVEYGESVYVGYRWYDARELAVTYPFGHGLSYTSFGYGGLGVTIDADGDLLVRVRVTNTGGRAGREVVQFYVSKPDSALRRAPRELRAFESVWLEAGESAEVETRIRRADLAYWDERIGGWVVEGGDYVISAAASSRDVRATATATVEGDPVRLPVSRDSTLGEVMAHPVAAGLLAELAGPAMGGMAESTAGADLGTDMARMMASIPIGRMAGLSGGAFDQAALDRLIEKANE